MKIIFERFY